MAIPMLLLSLFCVYFNALYIGTFMYQLNCVFKIFLGTSIECILSCVTVISYYRCPSPQASFIHM